MRPGAAAYLTRIAHLTGDASLARAHDDGRLALVADDELGKAADARLRSLAREERALHEEARSLAQARGWPLGGGVVPYGWLRLRGARLSSTLPEVLRILARDVAELEGFAREAVSEDDDVAALASRAATACRSPRQALAHLAPEASLPGAK